MMNSGLDAILDFLNLLANEDVRGWIAFIVTLFIISVTVGIAIFYIKRFNGFNEEILNSINKIQNYNRESFFRAIAQNSNEIENLKKENLLGHAWSEYIETLDCDIEKQVARSPITADHFFDPPIILAKHNNTKLMIAWPGTIILLGLFLTFLGLVAAIHKAAAIGGNVEATKELLTIASIKFISSLVAILCSISLDILLKRVWHKTTKLFSNIVDKLATLTEVVTAERILNDHLMKLVSLQSENNAAVYNLADNMAIKFDELLRENLRNSLNAAFMPAIEKLEQIGSKIGSVNGDAMKDMSSSFHSLLEDRTKGALDGFVTEFNGLKNDFAGLSSGIGKLAEQLNNGSSAIGSELSRSAGSIGDAAGQMQSTAQALLNQVGQQATNLEAITQNLQKTLGNTVDQVGSEMASQFRSILNQINEGTTGIFSQVDTQTSSVMKLSSQLHDLVDKMPAITRGFVDAAQPLQAITDKFGELILALNYALTESKQTSSAIITSGQQLTQAAQQFESAWKQHQDRFGEVDTQLANAHAVMLKGLESFQEKVRDWSNNINQPISSLTDLMKTVGGNVQDMRDLYEEFNESAKAVSTR